VPARSVGTAFVASVRRPEAGYILLGRIDSPIPLWSGASTRLRMGSSLAGRAACRDRRDYPDSHYAGSARGPGLRVRRM